VHRYYRGGEKSRPPKEFSLSDLVTAFETICDSGMSASEALQKFGSARKWLHFDEALQWMKDADEGAE
jgi:hypothetical protein